LVQVAHDRLIIVDRILRNAIKRHRYIDPEKALKSLRELERAVAQSDLDPKVKALRTNRLRRDRELREAALFCYGQSCRIQRRVRFFPYEDSNFDIVAVWENEGVQHVAPVQLKEVVPEHLNQETSLQSVINGLVKYPSSLELTVAIHVNREGLFDPNKLRIPLLSIGALWVFGSKSKDQSEWFLFGNMLRTPEYTFIQYPE
jgi:hypothetical protein